MRIYDNDIKPSECPECGDQHDYHKITEVVGSVQVSPDGYVGIAYSRLPDHGKFLIVEVACPSLTSDTTEV